MHSLRTFGAIGLTSPDGTEVDGVLRQPKTFALLVYLTLPSPGIWHRRDELLATFWPEFEQSRARSALRSTLYALRQNLPPGLIRTRGDDEVSVDPAHIQIDAATFASELKEGRFAEALALYEGEFLPAFYVSNAEGFAEWCEAMRRRTRTAASDAAHRLSTAREQVDDIDGAVAAIQRVVEIDPDNAAAARRLSELVAARSAALRRSAQSQHDAPTMEDRNAIPPRRQRTPMRWLVGAAGVAMAATVVLVVRSRAASSMDRDRERLFILPPENLTGDDSLAYVSSGMADGITRRLERIAALTVRSGAFHQPNPANDSALGMKLHATRVLRLQVAKANDSLELRTTLIDPATSSPNALPARRFVLAGLQDAESRATAAIVAAIFRRPIPNEPRPRDPVVDPESYRLTLNGWHELLAAQNSERAKELFLAATLKDGNNARAWSGLSSVWASQSVTLRVPFDLGYERAFVAADRARAIDSLQGSALANQAVLRALKMRRLSAGLALLKQAEAAEPSNPEIYLIANAMYRHAWQWDAATDAARIAQALDPFSPTYIDAVTTDLICAGKPQVALDMFREELRVSPRSGSAKFGLTRVLARLGQYDKALDNWRASVREANDTMLLHVLQSAHGERGYWNARHIEGRRTRERQMRQLAKQGWIAPVQLVQSAFAAGDTVDGFRRLEDAADRGDYALYKLPCMPDFDEVRGTPHFQQVMRRVGPLPP